MLWGDNVQDSDAFHVEYSMQHCAIHCCIKQGHETLVSTPDSANRLILIRIGGEDVARECCVGWRTMYALVAVAVLWLIYLCHN